MQIRPESEIAGPSVNGENPGLESQAGVLPVRSVPRATGQAADGTQRGDRIMILVYAAALVVFLAEATLLLLYRSVNQDEGWYLWAAKLVYEGKVLYRDFAFPQSPLLPYFYGPFQLVFGRGLYQGRVLTLLLALACLFLGARLAGRLALKRGGPDAWRARVLAETAYLAIALSTLFAAAYAFAYTAPYALASLLLVLGFYVAFSGLTEERRAALSMICLALATGVRLSAAPAFVPLALYLIITCKRRWRVAIISAGAAVLTLALIFGPFLATSGGALPYDIFGFHTDRMPRDFQIEAQQYSIRVTLRDFAVPLALGAMAVLALCIAAVRSRSFRRTCLRYLPEVTAGLACLLIFRGHLVPRTTNSFYNALQFPLLILVDAALLSGAGMALLNYSRSNRPTTSVDGSDGRPSRRGRAQGARWMAAGLVMAGIVAVNVRLQWDSLLELQLVTVPLENQVAAVREAAAYLTEHVPPGSPLVTFNPQVALEAGLTVPPGFEMSVFGYQPTWSTERAKAYRVINEELMLKAIDEARGAVAFTDYDLRETLKGQAGAIQASLGRSYRWARSVPGAGPVRDDLRIYLPPQYGPVSPPVAVPVSFEDGIKLLGYEPGSGIYRRGQPIGLALYWQSGAVPAHGYTVFVHLLDAEGKLAAGWDNAPCRRTCPTDTWHPGEVIRDEYALKLDEKHASGRYTVEAGMYDPQTGRRLPVLPDANRPAGDRVILGEVTIQ